MPLFRIERPIIAFNPNGNAQKHVPNLNSLDKSLGDSFPKEGLFLVNTIIVACMHSTKAVHDQSCPLSWLECNPKTYVLLDSLVLCMQKTHCLEMNIGGIHALHSFTTTTLCHINQTNASSFPDLAGSQACDQ